MQDHPNESTNAATTPAGVTPTAVAAPAGSPVAANSTIVLNPDDIASLVLWLDGMAKFIDITKAHLPDLYDSKVILMQRLSRHTFELKKRLQDARNATFAPKQPTEVPGAVIDDSRSAPAQ